MLPLSRHYQNHVPQLESVSKWIYRRMSLCTQIDFSSGLSPRNWTKTEPPLLLWSGPPVARLSVFSHCFFARESRLFSPCHLQVQKCFMFLGGLTFAHMAGQKNLNYSQLLWYQTDQNSNYYLVCFVFFPPKCWQEASIYFRPSVRRKCALSAIFPLANGDPLDGKVKRFNVWLTSGPVLRWVLSLYQKKIHLPSKCVPELRCSNVLKEAT